LHTVLVNNLANRSSRSFAELGGSVLQRPDPCPCGNPLPRDPRSGSLPGVLNFPDRDGNAVIPPRP